VSETIKPPELVEHDDGKTPGKLSRRSLLSQQYQPTLIQIMLHHSIAADSAQHSFNSAYLSIRILFQITMLLRFRIQKKKHLNVIFVPFAGLCPIPE